MSKYFKINDRIETILNKYPETIDFFVNKGFENLKTEDGKKLLGKLNLDIVLKTKSIGIEGFSDMLNDFIELSRNSADLTLNEKTKRTNGVKVIGLLPCPVRVPLLEQFDAFVEKSEYDIEYDLKAASHGLEWLKGTVRNESDYNNLADIYLSAGFDLFFDENLMGKFKKANVFKDAVKYKDYNNEFENLRDPSGDYSILAVVPAVFLVNSKELNGREIPKTWADLLKPEFEKSVSLPVSDFDLFNAILLNIYKLYGDEGVKKLGKSLIQNLHPAQMVKSDRMTVNRPTVTIMPYFFTRMTKEGGTMIPVWPEDGAIISPVFMLTKREKVDKMHDLIDFFSSKAVGEILSHKGFFPSVNPEVVNGTPEGKKYLWIGWDYIYNNNLQEQMHHCEDLFNKASLE
ncbi:MAG: ABC transporter substrate-binding protein [Fusobacteriaceae bacterium]|nr:ABC transporter substrate-binding protein [Fusobacteriaceae bacterium]MBP7859958.1 ABC transporter substrate-binding protein [Patescibacteria group bacterium]